MVQRVPPERVIAIVAQPGGGLRLDAAGSGAVVVQPQQQAAHIARPAQDEQRRQVLQPDLQPPRVLFDVGHCPGVGAKKRFGERRQEVAPRARVVLGEGRIGQEEEHIAGGHALHLRQLPIDHAQVLGVQRDQVRVADIAMLDHARQPGVLQRRDQLLRPNQHSLFRDVERNAWQRAQRLPAAGRTTPARRTRGRGRQVGQPFERHSHAPSRSRGRGRIEELAFSAVRPVG